MDVGLGKNYGSSQAAVIFIFFLNTLIMTQKLRGEITMKQWLKIIFLMMILCISGPSPLFIKTDDNIAAADSKHDEDQKSFYHQLLPLAAEGKLKHAEFPIGAKINAIMQEKGTPDEQGILGGAAYFVYGSVIYFVPLGEEMVSSIEARLAPDESIKLSEIESLIGKSAAGIEISELDQHAFLLYEFDSFLLYVEAEHEHAPAETVFLKMK